MLPRPEPCLIGRYGHEDTIKENPMIDCGDCKAVFDVIDASGIRGIKHCPYCGSQQIKNRADATKAENQQRVENEAKEGFSGKAR